MIFPRKGGETPKPSVRAEAPAKRYAELVIPGTIVGIVVGLVVSLVTGAWQPFDSRIDRTAVHLFSPQTGGWKLNSQYSAVSRDTGPCFPGASMAPQPETYRCIGERQIYQSCWGGPASPLVCVSSPWSNSATLLYVQVFHRAIGRAEDFRRLRWNPRSNRRPPEGLFAREHLVDITSERPPWAFELATGQRCVRVSGATYVIGGLRANYLCDQDEPGRDDSDPLNWVIGDPDRTTEPWEARYRPAGSSETTSVEVVDAWF